jgi:hypothetical protein
VPRSSGRTANLFAKPPEQNHLLWLTLPLIMKLDWKSIAITAVVSIVAVVFVWPLVKPYAQKIPVLGGYIS